MGWWITLGVVVLLALLPLGVSVKYNSEGPLVKVILGPIRITVFPLPKKEKKEPTEAQKQKAAEKAEKKEADKAAKKAQQQAAKDKAAAEKRLRKAQGIEEPKDEKGGSWTDFLPLVKEVFRFLKDFGRKLRIDNLEMKLIMGGGDPSNLAINYGRAWAALGNLLPQLEKLFVIKKRDLEIECDFTASETLVIARLDLTITLGRLLAAVFTLIGRALVTFIKILIKRKGGAKQ